MHSESTTNQNTEKRKVLIFDFETNGVDAKVNQPTELAAVLYEVERVPRVHPESPNATHDWWELARFESFIYEENYPPQSEHIIDVTGITDEMLRTHGRSRKAVAEDFERLYTQADIICAHKLDFDKSFAKQMCDVAGIGLAKKEELCTLTNFDWPKKYTCHKLGHLAWELGIDVKAADLHRAKNDVDLLARVLSCYNFDKVLEYSRRPWIYLKAEIVGEWEDGGTQKAAAQSLGFSWQKIRGVDNLNFPKKWVKRTKSQADVDHAIELGKSCANPFRVSIIQGIN